MSSVPDCNQMLRSLLAKGFPMQAIKHLLLICILLISFQGMSQSYGATFGLRLGNNPDTRSLGLTAQYRLARFVTMEGIFSKYLPA